MNKVWLLATHDLRWLCGVYADLKQAKSDAEQTYKRDMFHIYDKNCQNVTVEADWQKRGRRLLIMVGITNWDRTGVHHETRYPAYMLVSYTLNKPNALSSLTIAQKMEKVFREEIEKTKADAKAV